MLLVDGMQSAAQAEPGAVVSVWSVAMVLRDVPVRPIRPVKVRLRRFSAEKDGADYLMIRTQWCTFTCSICPIMNFRGGKHTPTHTSAALAHPSWRSMDSDSPASWARVSSTLASYSALR